MLVAFGSFALGRDFVPEMSYDGMTVANGQADKEGPAGLLRQRHVGTGEAAR